LDETAFAYAKDEGIKMNLEQAEAYALGREG
jgi:hypothetical protein